MNPDFQGLFLFQHLDDSGERWVALRTYYAKIATQMPHNARDYALAEWHYNYSDPRSPHDSWVRSISIETNADRSRTARISLLGAFHDRAILFTYMSLRGLSIRGQFVSAYHTDVDWLYDEVQINDSGNVVHIIQFEGAVIEVVCADLIYSSECIQPGPEIVS